MSYVSCSFESLKVCFFLSFSLSHSNCQTFHFSFVIYPGRVVDNSETFMCVSHSLGSLFCHVMFWMWTIHISMPNIFKYATLLSSVSCAFISLTFFLVRSALLCVEWNEKYVEKSQKSVQITLRNAQKNHPFFFLYL